MRRLAAVTVGAIWACAAFGQDATVPAEMEQAVQTVQGQGVQIYSCSRTAAGMEWVFVAPAARLFDKDGIEVGTHGDGPVWHFQDGSSVLGKVVVKKASPDAGSIPWLLLKALPPSETGTLARVDFIRRSETRGGAAPATGCDARHVGDMSRVPYTATYTFYSAK